jgi:acyl-CoA thioesterase-1
MTRRWVIFIATLIAALFAVLAGCGGGADKPAPPPAPAQAPARSAAAPPDDRPVILAFGDSLTAGHGLPPGESYADFLQKDLDSAGYRYRVANQGISGDTTDGGVGRLDSALALQPAIVILELGANDGLRGLPVDKTRENLDLLITSFQRAGAKVLLCGMTLPRNYGADYIRGFESIFQDLARQHKTALVPFFLDGVVTRPELMQSDGLHPTAEGCRRVAQRVFPFLKPLLAPPSR